jgi:hydrogenase maturation protease
MAGHNHAIIVDAIQTQGGHPGNVYQLQVGDLQYTCHSGSTHDLSLSGALDLGRALGMRLPPNEAIALVAVEVEDVLEFGETCTPAVRAAIPCAADAVLAELGINQ